MGKREEIATRIHQIYCPNDPNCSWTEFDWKIAKVEKLKKELLRVNPPHKHDHGYFHSNCGLCRMEKEDFEKSIVTYDEYLALKGKR